MDDFENIGPERDNLNLSAPVRQSLTHPKLVFGVEKKFFVLIVFIPVVTALAVESISAYLAAIIVIGIGLIVGRFLTKFDPYFIETAIAYLRHREFYGSGESPNYKSLNPKRKF